MNKLWKKITVLLCAVSLIVVPIGCGGCQSASRTAYVSSGVTHVSVAAALRTWNSYLGQKDVEITTMAKTDPDKARVERARIAEQNAKIEAAYKKYQLSQLAILTASENLSALDHTDPKNPGAVDRLATTIAEAAPALASVLDLIRGYLPAVK